MLKNPAQKYQAFAPINLENRTWVDKQITHPPIWLSSDLRDGNQALIEPMNIQQKLRLFNLLVKIGFKEIEIGFPSASQTEFDFVRYLIEQDLIPDDVTIQVLTPAREELIKRTFVALAGVKQAIVHFYNATSPGFRRIVFGLQPNACIDLAVNAAQIISESAQVYPNTNWRFEYSPETFSTTELEFSRDICNAVLDVWKPTPENPAIINLPATIEAATPNIFADQVEWMHRHLQYRDRIILSVHPHNDRGCGIAAAELAQMAGAQRVEGCLFGNGERTGNVDLVTLALNLYTQGIHPGLDFSDIHEIARINHTCTQIPVHPRHPYVGDLVFTAFSGSHQDAIKKGFAVQKPEAPWEIPYLPIDPQDIGRSYKSIVRVNSQSGKGGMAYLLERDFDVVLPRRLQIEFSKVVQTEMDASGKEMSSTGLWEIFTREYLHIETPLKYISHEFINQVDHDHQSIVVELQIEQQIIKINGQGNGPIDAFVNALPFAIQVHHYEERSQSKGSSAVAICCVEITTDWIDDSCHGVGKHANIITASLMAIISAVNRSLKGVAVDKYQGISQLFTVNLM